MHERFSDRARHAMALANREALKLSHDNLAPAHLMLGLIAEGECVAAEALRLLNVDLKKVREKVRTQLSRGSNGGPVGRIAHSEPLKDVINLAIAEARKFNHKYIGTEHLIIAILAQADSIPYRVLAEQGVNIETLREQTYSLLKGSVDDTHDLAHSRHGEFEWVHQQELAKAFRSPKFWHTMILAIDTANRLGASELEPKHILLALVRDTDNGIAESLKEQGVTAEWVQQKLNDGEPTPA